MFAFHSASLGAYSESIKAIQLKTLVVEDTCLVMKRNIWHLLVSTLTNI